MTGSRSSDAPHGPVTNERRRHLLRCLSGREAGLALADLATDVAAREADANPRDVPPATVERVSLSLYHCHVPKLADRGLVAYDADRKVVSLANEGEESEAIHRAIDGAVVRRRA